MSRLLFLQPEMFGGFSQGHSLFFLLDESIDKIFQLRTVIVPLFLLERRLGFDDVSDGV